MIIYRKKQIINIVLILFLLFGLYISASAQESIKVYNKGEEIILSHDLYSYNEQYYLHLNDLQQLGLSVDKANNTYTISSNDCLGVERVLVIESLTIGTGTIVTPVAESLSVETDSVIVNKVTCSGTYKYRSIKTIGYSTDISFLPIDSFSFSGNTDAMIKVDGEPYISAQFIGNKLSHEYSLENNRMNFYIADESTAIMETTVNLIRSTVAPSGGRDVDIYTAYRIGDGNTLGDFEILSSDTCTIKENESSATCFVETPAEKISDSNIYFIVDLGEKYALAYSEYDFSKVGKVLVYGQQKDVTYTVNVNLPEIDEQDVPFTIYVEADNNTYSKPGVVKSGEKSVVFEFEELPVAKSYSTRIEFGYHKYENAVLEDFELLNIAYAKDFDTDFTATYSREVVCNVSLPDGFIPDGDVEINVKLSKYVSINSTVIVNKLTDWSDTKTIILNNEKRSEQVYLYNQSSSSELSYKILDNDDGLCINGYLHKDGKITSDNNSQMEITEDLVADIQLLRKKSITVDVVRPSSLSVENDIFAKVRWDDISTLQNNDIVMNFTQIPLIPSGEKNAQFEFEIEEDKSYTLKITDITGDSRLFDYYCYVKTGASPADEVKKRQVGFSDESISLTLLQCNNVSGTIECEMMDLNFDVLGTCHLNNGETINLIAEAENGEFSFKIPEDTNTYMLSVQTIIGKKSYYISDGVSTNIKNEATDIFFEPEDDRTVIIKYILQKPVLPIEISVQNDYNYFVFQNVSDYLVEEYDAYVAYYDIDEMLISVGRSEEQLISGSYLKLPINTDNGKIKKVKAFAWERDGLTPLGNVVEISVNQSNVSE